MVKARYAAMAAMLALTQSACNQAPPKPADRTADAVAAPIATKAPLPEPSPTPDDTSEPGTSLAFEWSANGFEQLDARYAWTGSGVRDDVFMPNVSLSVPETDDAIWSSSCAAGGKVETQIYLAAPKGMTGNRAIFYFETEQSPRTRSYPVRYITGGQYDGFVLIQSTNDPMFAEMKTGQWAYIQIGEGSDAAKLRVALNGAAPALNAFLPACSDS